MATKKPAWMSNAKDATYQETDNADFSDLNTQYEYTIQKRPDGSGETDYIIANFARSGQKRKRKVVQIQVFVTEEIKDFLDKQGSSIGHAATTILEAGCVDLVKNNQQLRIVKVREDKPQK